MNFINTLKNIQSFINSASSIPIFYCTIHFIVTFIFSTISFKFFLNTVESVDDLIKALEKIEELSKKFNKRLVKSYIIRYSFVTGTLATVLVSMQRRNFDPATAIIYSLLGPFFIKKTFVNSVMDKTIKNAKEAINDIPKEEDSDYQTKLNKIKKEL